MSSSNPKAIGAAVQSAEDLDTNTVIGGAIERRLKAEIVEAAMERAKLDDLEIVRIQFLEAPPKAAKKRPRSVTKKASA